MPIHRLSQLISLLLLLTVAVCPGAWGGIDTVTDDGIQSKANVTWGVKIITVSYWQKWDTYDNTDDLLLETGPNIAAAGGAADGGIYINPCSGNPAANYYAAAIQDSTGTTPSFRIESITRPSADVWHHLSIIFDNSTTAGDIIFYVDGILTASGLNLNTKTQSSNILTEKVNLLSRNASTLNADAELNEFYVHSGALSEAEILQLARSNVKGIGKQFDNFCFIYLPFNDQPSGSSADGDTVRDLSGNENDFTATDGANNTGCTWTAEQVLSYPGDE